MAPIYIYIQYIYVSICVEMWSGAEMWWRCVCLKSGKMRSTCPRVYSFECLPWWFEWKWSDRMSKGNLFGDVVRLFGALTMKSNWQGLEIERTPLWFKGTMIYRHAQDITVVVVCDSRVKWGHWPHRYKNLGGSRASKWGLSKGLWHILYVFSLKLTFQI